MDSLAETLSIAEIETVRRALKATVEGSFFPDWEFETLIGVNREMVQQVCKSLFKVSRFCEKLAG